MNAHYRLKRTLSFLFVLTAAAGCGSAAKSAYSRGAVAETTRDFQGAMEEYKAAMAQDPGNPEYRLRYERARLAAAFDHFDKGRRALAAADMETARTEFNRAIEIDPTNAFARSELAKVEAVLTSRSRKEPEPQYDVIKAKEGARTDPSPIALLAPKFSGPIDFRMNAQSRAIYETLAQLSGINVIFDTTFTSQPKTLELVNVSVWDALDILGQQSQNSWQPVNQTTIVVFPDNATKHRDYDQLVLKTIYLTNPATTQDLNDIVQTLRTVLTLTGVQPVPAQNAIIVRDTAYKVALAEQLISNVDKSKPEVVIEVTVLEVDRQELRQLGILPPQTTGLSLNTPAGATAPTVPIGDLNNLNAGSFLVNIPAATAQFIANGLSTKLFQNPSVRVSDGKTASLKIGSRVPVATSVQQTNNANTTLGPIVQVQFLDIGVNLDILPRVLLNRDVSLTTTVSVSGLAGERIINTVSYPVISNRSITHDIRLSEGETNILGGIISNTESISNSGIPGLKDIPILKYLFGQEKRERDETEVIIMMTPHIIRMPELTEENLRAIFSGTNQNFILRSIEVPTLGTPRPSPATPAQPAPAGGGPAGTPAPGTTSPTTSAPTPLPPGVTIPGRTVAALPPEPKPTNTTLTAAQVPVLLPTGAGTGVNFTINGSDIFGADITLAFDPASVSIEDVREAGFLSRDGTVIPVTRRVETEAGLLHISLERPSGSAALSGTGALVTVTLKPGAKKGPTVLKVTEFRVRDARLNVGIGKPTEVQVTLQ